LKFKGPDESDPVEFIDCSECSFVINNNMSSLEGLFQREAIDKSLGMLDITGSITEYVDTGKLYNLAKEGASGELHVMLSRGDYSYELIARISFDNSTLSGDSQLSVALPFKTYGEDRFTIRKSVPAAPPVAVTGVSLNENTLTLSVGDTDTLIATVQPADASNRNVAWESDDTDIATVDASGLVEAIAAGVANITVTTDDGGFTDTCEVTVS
jgi:hypothetical protein